MSVDLGENPAYLSSKTLCKRSNGNLESDVCLAQTPLELQSLKVNLDNSNISHKYDAYKIVFLLRIRRRQCWII